MLLAGSTLFAVDPTDLPGVAVAAGFAAAALSVPFAVLLTTGALLVAEPIDLSDVVVFAAGGGVVLAAGGGVVLAAGGGVVLAATGFAAVVVVFLPDSTSDTGVLVGINDLGFAVPPVAIRFTDSGFVLFTVDHAITVSFR